MPPLLRSIRQRFDRKIAADLSDHGAGPIESCSLCQKKRRDVRAGLCAPCTTQAW
jgi:hypothetical protein